VPGTIVSEKPFTDATIQASRVITLDQEPVAGNLLVLVFTAGPSATVDTPSGWTKRTEVNESCDFIIFDRDAPASFGTTITVTQTGSSRACAYFCEVGGMQPASFDKSATNTVDNGGTGTTAALTQADEFAIGAVSDLAVSGGTGNNYSAWSNGYVEKADLSPATGTNDPQLGVAVNFLTSAAATSTTPTGGTDSGAICTYKATLLPVVARRAASTWPGAGPFPRSRTRRRPGDTTLVEPAASVTQRPAPFISQYGSYF